MVCNVCACVFCTNLSVYVCSVHRGAGTGGAGGVLGPPLLGLPLKSTNTSRLPIVTGRTCYNLIHLISSIIQSLKVMAESISITITLAQILCQISSCYHHDSHFVPIAQYA